MLAAAGERGSAAAFRQAVRGWLAVMGGGVAGAGELGGLRAQRPAH